MRSANTDGELPQCRQEVEVKGWWWGLADREGGGKLDGLAMVKMPLSELGALGVGQRSHSGCVKSKELLSMLMGVPRKLGPGGPGAQ